ncbi:TPA: glycosyltransferase family A protein [Streptococcus agalactiae]
MLYIFTPTFNRGYRLSYLYDSLCNQTNKNFIWLIVDDGSEDSTKEIVSNYIKENKVSIV